MILEFLDIAVANITRVLVLLLEIMGVLAVAIITGTIALIVAVTAVGAALCIQQHDTWAQVSDEPSQGYLAAMFTAGIVYLIVKLIEESITLEPSTDSSNSRNWPSVTAVEKLTAYLPTTYPFERHAHVWPPFTGLRVSLGGDTA